MADQSKKEISIALIGLVGILVTAFFSNWDKLFPPENVLETTFIGYRLTDDFETELRYYIEVSGTRKTIESMQEQVLNQEKMQLLQQYPADSEKTERLFQIIKEEAITVDEVVKEMIPIYKNHFTLEEIQELNKFYSTEIMQSMIKKMPLVNQEFAPIQLRMMKDYYKRVYARIVAELSNDSQ